MPPRLHPRSTFTSSIFVTTLAASFLVVGLPHILPCPAPRVVFADGDIMIGEDGRRMRRRRKCPPTDSAASSEPATPADLLKDDESGDDSASLRELKERSLKRECPIPKPGGKVGEILGFKPTAKEIEEEKTSSRPP